MGSLKEIGQTIFQFAKTEATGVSFDLQRNNYQGVARRILVGIPRDLKSTFNELQNSGAQHHFNYDQIIDRRNRIDFIDPGYGSLRMMLANFYLDRRSKNDIEGKKIARFHYKHQDALINVVSSLTDGQSLAVLLPHGLNIDAGVAAAIFTNKSGKIEAYSRLLPEMKDQQAMDLFSNLVDAGGQTINLSDDDASPLWMGVTTDSNNLDFIKEKEVFDNFLTGIFGQDFLKGKVTTCLDGGSCSSAGGQAVNQELSLAPAMALAGGGLGGGGGGGDNTGMASENDFLKTETSVLSISETPSFLSAAALSTPALSITQSVAPEVIFATALHSTVVNEMEQNLERAVHLESAQVEEKSSAIQPIHIIPVVSKTESVPMFRIIRENSERVRPKEEWAQVQKVAAESVSINLAIVKAEFEETPIIKAFPLKPKGRWQTRHAVASLDCPKQEAVVAEKAVIGLAQREQQPILKKAVKELSLPLLEISAETALLMILRAELRPVVKADEAVNFETEAMAVMKNERSADEKVVSFINEFQALEEKKAMVEVDQEETKLFLVENFSVTHNQVIKNQDAQPLRFRKMFWRIKARESQATEASILEFELPKDQNQRLYAFYHFLQKVVKKVIGQDAIRTRQVTVIAEKEDVNFDLELISEIEYYLQLLKRKRNYAQTFAFVN